MKTYNPKPRHTLRALGRGSGRKRHRQESAVAAPVSQASKFRDNRPAGNAQRKLLEMGDSSPRMHRLAQLQTMADKNSLMISASRTNDRTPSRRAAAPAVRQAASPAHVSNAGDSGIHPSEDIIRSKSLPRNAGPVTIATQAMVIQRLMRGKYLRKKAGHDPNLQDLADELDDYNTRVKKRKADFSDPERLAVLHALSRRVFAWYNQQDTTDLSTLAGDVPNLVRQIEAQIDTEHELLVQRIAESGQPVFGRAETGAAGAIPVEKVWASIRDGSGNLKIHGSEPFKMRVRSMLVRILATPKGSQLLAYFVRGGKNDRTVTIGEQQPPAAQKPYLFEESAVESKAIPQLADVPAESGEAPVFRGKKALLQKLTELVPLPEPDAESDRDDFPLFRQPIDLQQAALDGKPGIRVEVEKKQYRYFAFGPGARGVYVAIIRSTESLDNPSLAGKSVHTPEFVTLAHELGHALNQLAGSAVLENEELFKLFAGEDIGTFEAPGPKRTQWSNAEELFNILGLENEIRKAVGLAERGGHAGVVDQELIDRLNDEKQLIGGVFSVVTELGDRVPQKDAVLQALYDLYISPVKGLSQQEKRLQCKAYEDMLFQVLKLLSKKKLKAAAAKGLQAVNNGENWIALQTHLPKLADLFA